MPRPTSKLELLELGQSNFDKLIDFVENMSLEEQNKKFPEGTMNRNIGDIYMLLHRWHLMVMNWYKVGMTGQKPDMPAKGYTWKTTPELNKWIWENYKDTNLNTSKTELKTSYTQLRTIIESNTNEELFEKKKYKWTGTNSLGSYLISATSSHYDWAFKLTRKAKKARK